MNASQWYYIASCTTDRTEQQLVFFRFTLDHVRVLTNYV